MGYLAYNSKTKKVFIPNDEVRGAFLRAIRNDGWEEVVLLYKQIDGEPGQPSINDLVFINLYL